MLKTGEFVPVFYTRGLNAPYTEGHIQIVRMMTRSLMLYGIRSVIFNFKYNVDGWQTEDDFVEKFGFQQRVPFVNREAVIGGRNRALLTYALLTETLKMPRFFLSEKALNHKNCVVNVVNCFRYPRVFVKKMLKAPLILHFYIPNLRGQYLTTLFANKADLIIASSQGVARHLKKVGVSKKKIAILYPPVDTDLFKPLKQMAQSRLGLSKEAKTILYIGDLKPARFSEDTVLSIIEELAKEVPEASLLIFSPKSDFNIKRVHQIRRKAENLGLKGKVKVYAKNLSEKEKAIIYAASDIFFFPESGFRAAVEPPLTVLEAMASGSVVFAPKFSTLEELIKNSENGFLFETSDIAMLSDKLANLLCDINLRTRISHNARQTVLKKASLAICGQELFRLQNTLLNINH